MRTHLDRLSEIAQQLHERIKATASSASQVSAQVKELDELKQRISDDLDRATDIVDLKVCHYCHTMKLYKEFLPCGCRISIVSSKTLTLIITVMIRSSTKNVILCMFQINLKLLDYCCFIMSFC